MDMINLRKKLKKEEENRKMFTEQARKKEEELKKLREEFNQLKESKTGETEAGKKERMVQAQRKDNKIIALEAKVKSL